MNKFLVFPYENHIENILKSLEDKMYGRVEDILTLNGWWVKTKPEIHVGNKEIKIKKNIDEISKECNSLWVVESYFSLDFISEIVPILIYAKEKRWTVYYGRRTSDSEEKIIREIIDKNKLHMNEKLNGKNWEENRIYDIKSPVIWIVDMFPQMPMNSLALELWKAFEQQGYKTELISKRKDVSLVSKAISFPDIKNENKIEMIKEYNNFFEKIEKNNKKEIIIVEIPGNLLEISKKIYGDFGMTAYFMMRIMPPDFVICNIPYMEYIIENLEVLSETVKNTINIPIDIYNMNPVYFDLLASEQMENFEYVLLSDKYIDQIVGKSNIYNICTKERINKIIEKIITQLKGYII